MALQLITLLLILSTLKTSTSISNQAAEYLNSHNKARAEVGVPPLQWSESLFNATTRLVRYQKIHMSCNFANLTSGKYGANQLWASGLDVTPTMAVNHWVEEKSFYNHGDNTCAPNHRCGVYTQVVWRKSRDLGCDQAVCDKGGVSVTLTVCFYSPPGNVVGESPF